MTDNINIKQLRVACSLTLREAAKLTETNRTYLSQLEEGEVVDEDAYRRISEILSRYFAHNRRACRS